MIYQQIKCSVIIFNQDKMHIENIRIRLHLIILIFYQIIEWLIE